MMNTHKLTLLAVLTASAIAISILESFIPNFGIPGIKLGFANIVILITLYELGPKEAIGVNLMRVYLASLLRGTILSMGFLMSLSGAILSFIIMLVFYLWVKKFSIIGVSVLGAIFHVIGQILVAMAYLGSASIVLYLPIIAISSIVTGVIVGVIANIIIKSGVIKKQKDKYNF